MRRIQTPQSLGRDYKKMLKDYFGKYLYGLEVENKGNRVQVQVIYFDFKHIETVRSELTQMMPEVEFIKLKRDYTDTAIMWAFHNIMWEKSENNQPVIYVKCGENLVKASLRDIATSELAQLDFDEGDIDYPSDDHDLECCRRNREEDDQLVTNAMFD